MNDIRQLTIELTDEFKTFTEQLDDITQQINDGKTFGAGWQIQPNGNEINSSWHIEDVKSMEGYEDMSDEECRQVLSLAKNNHDATVGINWDVLQVWADEVRSGNV